MKFKHGILLGFVTGFLTVCTVIASRESWHEQDLKKQEADIENRGYGKGFSDGKDFALLYHKSNHPECGKCPH